MTTEAESKIQLVDRLRRDGLWDGANEFLERTRQELRAQGKTRKEAKEAAWALLADEYPLQTREFKSAGWLAAAEMPPQCCLDGPSGGRFELLWKAFCGLLAADAFLDESDGTLAEEIDPIAARIALANVVASTKTSLERYVAIRAVQNPDIFLDEVAELFGSEIERLDLLGDERNDLDTKLLSAFVGEIPLLKIRLASL